MGRGELVGRKAEDLSGRVFSRLKVLSRAPGGGNPRWNCACECGSFTVVYSHNLKAGKVKSCGCLRDEHRERVLISGYAFVKSPGHPRANPRTKRVREHILVMEQVLGRYLLPGEEVHHKNGVRDDNRKENLELWVKSQPAGQRPEDLVAWAEEILTRYAPHKLTTR